MGVVRAQVGDIWEDLSDGERVQMTGEKNTYGKYKFVVLVKSMEQPRSYFWDDEMFETNIWRLDETSRVKQLMNKYDN